MRVKWTALAGGLCLSLPLVLATGCKGPPGADGTSCSVSDNGDGTATISCDDGKSYTVTNGTDGADGTSCTVADNNNGTATISCTDGTSYTVTDGQNGTDAVDTGKFTVTVLDSAGAPIEGADVSTDPASASATTDASGVATLTPVPVGIYNVWAKMDGYRADMQSELSVVAGAEVSVSLELGPGVEYNLIHVVGISGARGDTDLQEDPRITLTAGDDYGIITSGLRNVGAGKYVYLTGAAADADENDITAWAWTVEGPPGSTVAPEWTDTGDAAGDTPRTFTPEPDTGASVQTRWMRFRTDLPGRYDVELTGTTDSGEVTSSIVIYAGIYQGEQACASCHSNPSIVGEDRAVYDEFLLTGHATKFQNTYSFYSSSMDYCIGCHTTAYDESSWDGGFDDGMYLSGWDPLQDGSVGSYLEAHYPTIDDFVSAPETKPAQVMMNIQCEECHGPGSNHPDAEAHLSFSPGVCKQCHPQPNQWALSGHGIEPPAHMAGSATCAPCHTGQGYVVNQIQGKAVIFPDDAPPGTEATVFEPGNAQPIGCATCHDPHAFTYPYDNGSGQLKSDQLRIEGAVTSVSGLEVADPGKGAQCFKCHGGRHGADYKADFVAGNESRGPHHDVQGEVLMSSNGYEYAGKSYASPSHGAYTSGPNHDECVTCHMNTKGTEADCSQDAGVCEPWETCSHGLCEADKVGGHTFAMSWIDPDTTTEYDHVQACQGCHSDPLLETFNREIASGDGWDCDGTTTGIQDEIGNMLDKLSACLIAANANLDDGDGAVISSGLDDATITAQQRQAVWNLEFVGEDGSEGVHNPKYAMELLRDSYDDMGCTPALTCTRP